MKTLSEVVAENPYSDYGEWWGMGDRFVRFMSGAIGSEWRDLGLNRLEPVQEYAARYIEMVYDRIARPALVSDFAGNRLVAPLLSGEFDALSYAFFRSAFESIEAAEGAYDLPVPQARRHFTQRVGRRFYTDVHDHLGLDLPSGLDSKGALDQLQREIARVGAFLVEEGYLRDHFAFSFDVHITHNGFGIDQLINTFIEALQKNGFGYALYEMGYPVILPSAVYLYQTIGEAQHHSSRTIEELFARAGCEARETDDFDPTGYPSDKVVELWEIRTHGR